MESVEEFKPKNKGEKPKFVARTTTDIQRIKLEKLMKNPQKDVYIPQSSSKKHNPEGLNDTPSFVRNVMGSSAGAGSGEFHVYRHLRRKEYARQKQMQQESVHEQMEQDFHNKLENNRSAAEQKTAKKQAKRLKKKQSAKNRKLAGPVEKKTLDSPSSDADSDADEDKSEKEECDKSNAPQNKKRRESIGKYRLIVKVVFKNLTIVRNCEDIFLIFVCILKRISQFHNKC